MDGSPYINYPGKIAIALYDIIKAEPGTILFIWKISGVLFGALLCFLAASNFRKPLPGQTNKFYQSPVFFITVAIIGIIVLRLPYLVLRDQTSDENFWIANTGKFLSGAVLWKNVTGATGGPLVYVPVSIMYYLFGGINYATLRLFGLIFCIIPALIFAYLTFLRLFNKATAALLVLPLIAFFAFSWSKEIIAYNSEHPSMALTAFALWLLVGLKVNRKIRLVILGIVIGCIPYAKLQGSPVALAIIICSLIEIFFFFTTSFREKMFSFFLFVMGGITPTLFLLLYLSVNSAVPDFWNGYILDNLQYTKNFTVHYTHDAPAVPAGNTPVVSTPHNKPKPVQTKKSFKDTKIFAVYKMLKDNGTEIFIFIITVFVLMGLAFFMLRRRKVKASFDKRRIYYFSLISVFSVIAIATPHTHFAHYLFLTIIPFLLLAGELLGLALPFVLESHSAKKIIIIYFIIVMAVPLAMMWHRGNRAIDFVKRHGNYNITPVSEALTLYTHPNEKMAMWGEESKFYVETDLIPATKGLPLFDALYNPAKRNTYMEEYVNEIRENNPVAFVDDITSNSFLYYDTAMYKHEHYPLLNNIISKNYSLVKDTDEERIYILNSRLAEMGIQKKNSH